MTLTEDLALQQAADADREIKAGKYRGPLHGLPWGAKDLFATKGIRTTWGGEPYVDQVIDYDATVVERLREAGAVLVAKLTLGALAQGDRWFGGQHEQPVESAAGLERDRRPGPGSATAAGCVAFAIGTETRGSIISPSSVNGVVGLRPTYGRVSRYGAMALSNTMDKVGPMCRYVEDSVLVLNAIYGPDKRDGTVADAAFKWNPDLPLAGIRIAYVRSGVRSRRPRRGARRGARRAGGGARRGGGRGGATPATGRQQQRRKMYQDVLDDVSQARREARSRWTCRTCRSPSRSAFILEVEAAASFDELTRSGDVDLLPDGHVAQHLAEHVQGRALRAGGRVPPRAARPHDPHAADGRVHEQVRRAASARQRRARSA